MIDHLDTLLHRLFRNSIAELTSDAQVRFQPPDEDWRASGADDHRRRRQSRPIRSTSTSPTCARTASCAATSASARWSVSDVFETPPPRRVDCHYLISAWSPVAVSIGDRSDARRACAARRSGARAGRARRARPGRDLCARRTRPEPPPAAIADERFPITLLPVDGFPKIAEFWGTMGEKNRWKPFLYAVVTVALREAPRARRADRDDDHHAHAAARRARVGEHALPHRRHGARRRHVHRSRWRWRGSSCSTAGNERRAFTRADALGRFVFADVAAGAWRLQASAAPLGVERARAISSVPEPTGSYDVVF